MKATAQQIREMFQRSDLRCTRQRELVYGALCEMMTHPTAEELFARVHDEGLSLATVYNTLEAMTAAGLCSRIPCPTGAGACRYDAVTRPHAHVTTPEGRVLDLPADLSERLMAGVPPDLVAEIERRMGVRVDRVNVQVVAAPGA